MKFQKDDIVKNIYTGSIGIVIDSYINTNGQVYFKIKRCINGKDKEKWSNEGILVKADMDAQEYIKSIFRNL